MALFRTAGHLGIGFVLHNQVIGPRRVAAGRFLSVAPAGKDACFTGHARPPRLTIHPHFSRNMRSTKSESRNSRQDKYFRAESRDFGKTVGKEAVGRWNHSGFKSVSDFEPTIPDLSASHDSLFSCMSIVQVPIFAVKENLDFTFVLEEFSCTADVRLGRMTFGKSAKAGQRRYHMLFAIIQPFSVISFLPSK